MTEPAEQRYGFADHHCFACGTTNPIGFQEPRGGLTGGSGRVLFTPVQKITVQ